FRTISKVVLLHTLLCLSTLLYSQSNAQLNDLIQKAKNSGISERNIDKIVNESGINKNNPFEKQKESLIKSNIDNDKILKDIQQIEDSEISNNKDEPTDDSEDEPTDDSEDDIDSNDEDLSESILEDKNPDITYYGYDIFSSDPGLFQKSSAGSVDPNYIISPGDEVIIMIWGQTEINKNFVVSKDGYLFIENVGQIFVNGLTLSALEVKLLKHLKKVYSSLSGNQNATSYLDVTLGGSALRPKRIFALGEIKKPGAYETLPSTSLFTSLFYFNGPTFKGSLRNIELIRNGKKINEIDYYSYLLFGNQVNDVRLQRDDVVFIPRRGRTITMKGEISRPAIYELKQSEELKELIEIAGGLKATTYNERCQIYRIIPISERKKSGPERTLIDVDLKSIFSESKNINLFDGDVISFFSISDVVSNVVTVNGQVMRPGDYQLTKKMKLSDLIEKADGLTGTSYLDNVLITRVNKDGTSTQFSVNLEKALMDDLEHNKYLQSNDLIQILDYRSLKFSSSLQISGHVFNPGVKPFKENMTVYDLLFLGGGFENDNHLANTYKERADYTSINKNGININIIKFNIDSVLAGKGIANQKLKMGDKIRVYSKTEILGEQIKKITINGYVKNPGDYDFYNNATLKDILFQAGGFEDSTFNKDIFYNRAIIFFSTYHT
ncbi:SLBB domain-containing protein, partial [bacterium]|nr:SLBB domain-containing protein [bacterium]